MVPFLSTVGLNCPVTYNPADYIIEATDGEEMENITKLAAATNNGKLILYKTQKADYYLEKKTTRNGNNIFINNNNQRLQGNLTDFVSVYYFILSTLQTISQL